jgi:NAD(P)-dependent dehydrogenase (short-subunit alcohol dehydrogenase family)
MVKNKMKKRLVLFGATGGLGSGVYKGLTDKYDVIPLGSSDIDVTNFEEVKYFFGSELDIDIVINLSGKKYDTFLHKIDHDDINEIRKMIDVNIMGNINIMASCLPYMRETGWGRVILISSIFSKLNVPKNSIYCSSKSFLDRFVSNANKENVRKGVTCNSIQLGYWEGGMFYDVPEDLQQRAINKIGLQRCGKMEELVRTINFIVDTEYVSGTNLKIDGGM